MKSMTCNALVMPNQGDGEARFYTGVISDVDGGVYFLDEDLLASAADGLGVSLIKGDLVSYLETSQGIFIVALLVAAPRAKMSFGFSCSERLTVTAEEVEIVGQRSVALRSLQSLSLETCHSLKIHCRDLYQVAAGTVVNVMTHWVQKCSQGSIETEEVLRSNAGSHIVTAKADLRLDAKRINMG